MVQTLYDINQNCELKFVYNEYLIIDSSAWFLNEAYLPFQLSILFN